MGILKWGVIYGRNQEEIHGRSAHGSAPDQGKDAIVAAAAVVMGLQTLSSRVNDPQNTFVLTVGMMNGGTQSNIIADEVELVGTTRAFDKVFRKSLPQLIEACAAKIAEGYGCRAECSYRFGPSPLINEHKDLNASRARPLLTSWERTPSFPWKNRWGQKTSPSTLKPSPVSSPS